MFLGSVGGQICTSPGKEVLRFQFPDIHTNDETSPSKAKVPMACTECSVEAAAALKRKSLDHVGTPQFKSPSPKTRKSSKQLHLTTSTGHSRGLKNLAIIATVILVCKVVLGLVSTAPHTRLPGLGEVLQSRPVLPNPALAVYPLLALLLTFRVELLLSAGRLGWCYALICHVATLLTALALPVLLLEQQDSLDGLLMNVLLVATSIILVLKIVSYIQVNRRLRRNTCSDNNNEESAVYPDNLTLSNLFLFWCSPVVVYQPAMVGGSTIKAKCVIMRLLEIALFSFLTRALLLAFPSTLLGLIQAADRDDILTVAERYLTLTLLYMMTWGMVFFLLFVSYLPLLAELCRTKERHFFHAWWNSGTMEEFWRSWNLPVHRWCVKHIYIPLVELKLGAKFSKVSVFVVSAFLHEYLICSPIRILGHFALVSFLAQLPICKLSNWFRNRFGDTAGNVLVWVILVFGNVTGVVLYFLAVQAAYPVKADESIH